MNTAAGGENSKSLRSGPTAGRDRQDDKADRMLVDDAMD